MGKRFVRILGGWMLWKLLSVRYGINYEKVILILTGQNENVDDCCVEYLRDFVKRKHAKRAILFCMNETYEKLSRKMEESDMVRICRMESGKMKRLYAFYEFDKFFDNIVFTYTDSPKDNYLGRYLRETDITQEDAACLALYHLRHVLTKA